MGKIESEALTLYDLRVHFCSDKYNNVFTTFTSILGRWGDSRWSPSSPSLAFSNSLSCLVTLSFSPIQISRFCNALNSHRYHLLCHHYSLLWLVDKRLELERNIITTLYFYQNYERYKLLDDYKIKNELKLKFVISKFKGEYWDNTKSKEKKRGRVGKGAKIARIASQSWYWYKKIIL